jgi:hypothetical protein
LLAHVKAINEGNITRSITCHSYMFLYMLYYCHFIPAVRMYDVEILDPKNKTKINKQSSYVMLVHLRGFQPMLLLKCTKVNDVGTCGKIICDNFLRIFFH